MICPTKTCGSSSHFPPFASHLPPIIIGSGSLHIEMPHKLQPGMLGSGDPSGLGHINKVQSPAYGSIVYIEVKQTIGGKDTYCLYENLPKGCELHIWLEKLTAPATPLELKPQIRLKGARIMMNSSVEIKSDMKLDGGTETVAPFKYTHNGYGSTLFRIGKWVIVDSGGNVVKGCLGKSPRETCEDCSEEFSHEGADSYLIAVGFED